MGLDVNSEFGHSEFLLVPDVTFPVRINKDIESIKAIGISYKLFPFSYGLWRLFYPLPLSSLVSLRKLGPMRKAGMFRRPEAPSVT